MATQTATMKYATRATYGSEAYDLSRLKPAYVPQDIPLERPVERPAERPAARPAAKPRTRTAARPAAGYAISVFSVVGFVLLVGLSVLLLFSYIERTALSKETVELQTKLDGLTEQGKKLQISYEKAFDVNQIEQYATKQLGMMKPAANQITNLNNSSGDRAVVVGKDDNSGTILSGISAAIQSVLAYFK